MVSHGRGRRVGLKVALGWALAWVALGLGCAAENTRPPSGGDEVLVVVVALDLKDNTVLDSARLARLAPDRPLGAGMGLSHLLTQYTLVDGVRQQPLDYRLCTSLRFPREGEVLVDASWETPGSEEVDRAETPLSLDPGSSAVLILREEGKPRIAVQFVVVRAGT